MIGRVTEITSGQNFVDKVKRVMLRFAEASFAYRDLQIPVDLLPNGEDVQLDQEYNVVLQKVIEVKSS